MKVVFIAGSYQPHRCGVADYLANLRSHLPLSSVVLTTKAAAESGLDPSVQGAVTRWTLPSLLPLAQAILKTPGDLLHIQHAAGSYRFRRPIFLLPPLLRRLGYRAPIVTTAHEYGWWDWQPAWFPQPLLSRLKTWGQTRYWWDEEDGFLLTGSDRIITTSQAITTAIQARLPKLAPRLVTIPLTTSVRAYPIARAQARTQLLQRCGWSEPVHVIVFFGFLHPVKGLETLLSAFQQVHRHCPQARLLIVGGVETLSLPGAEADAYWRSLQAQVSDLNLCSVVHLTGYLDSQAASALLSGADVGALPFNHGVTLKSSSLLALLAHRLPTVIAETADTDAILKRGMVRRVPSRQVDPLVLALTDLLADPARRAELADQGHRFVQPRTWEAIAQQHLDLYRALL